MGLLWFNILRRVLLLHIELSEGLFREFPRGRERKR
jgi:hypothetical protein